ncbi:hypothetical protein J9317_05840 [Metabacillus sp. KIGAM252]|uniref:Excalibur calcium-binding domain-containing protein n=1 Tax=Metabacillus flavus TaxID=2823519 RepID=A0ABS5LC30_9BACI|nr:hypothetical protein [Metabacillus flavus]MBS2968278.1 hypothetical protein [Metabacillus flavus]
MTFLTWIGMLLLAVLIFMVIRLHESVRRKIAIGAAGILAVFFLMLDQPATSRQASVIEETPVKTDPSSDEEIQKLKQQLEEAESKKKENEQVAETLKQQLADAEAKKTEDIQAAVKAAEEKMAKAHQEEMKQVLDHAFKQSNEKAEPVQAYDDSTGDPETPSDKPSEFDPFGPDLDCGDFPSQADAQSVYETAGGPGKDPHDLDRDNDGMACDVN